MPAIIRLLPAFLLAALLPLGPALAQSSEPAPQPPGLADLPVPAPETAECRWLGERILMLLWRDDIDTANRFLGLYLDRFDCPKAHVGLAFRCLVQVGDAQSEGEPGLPERAGACWANPALDPARFAPAPAPEQPAEEGEVPAEGEQQDGN